MKANRKRRGIPPFILHFGTFSNQSIVGWVGVQSPSACSGEKLPLTMLRIDSRNRPVHRLCSLSLYYLGWKLSVNAFFYGFFNSNSQNNSQNLILLLLPHHISKSSLAKSEAYIIGLDEHFCSPLSCVTSSHHKCYHLTIVYKYMAAKVSSLRCKRRIIASRQNRAVWGMSQWSFVTKPYM